MAHDCILWQGKRNRAGYGRIICEGLEIMAHRWVYARVFGNIPPRKIVRHTCDTPACVNINHLVLGTQLQNIQDIKDRGRPIGRKKKRSDVLIKELHNAGMTQYQIAEKLKITQPTVSRALKRGPHAITS